MPPVEQVIEQVLRQYCKVQMPDGAGPQTRLVEDLGLDSLGLLTLTLELENHYQKELGEDPEDPPRTLGQLAELLRKRQHG